MRLTVPAGRGVAGTLIDLLDSQLVAAPHVDLVAANVLLLGDDPSRGAGSWYTIVKGHQVSLSTPAPDGSVHTGVGFYGKYASAGGGSTNVHLSGFAIEGDVRERIDLDQVNGIGGARSNSSIDGLYLQHTRWASGWTAR